jgi:PAS domain S-box-containing protein
MSNHNNPLMDAGKELNTLRQEVAKLRQYKQALDANRELMSNFITMSQSASGRLLTRALLQQTLQITTNLTKAEESSIFLLDAEGVVQESLLARGALMREEKNNLIGQVLKEGLAGWVYQNRKTGVIVDTRIDSRWVNLPSQPYSTLSALCVPLIRGRSLLGIITFTHSQADFFTPEITELMEITATQIALVFDQMRFYLEKKLLQPPSTQPQETPNLVNPVHETPQTPPPPSSIVQEKLPLSELGMYILTQDGRFIYADPRFAEIFGYSLSELVSLESFFSLAISDNKEALKERFMDCFQGKNPKISVKFQGSHKNARTITIKLYGRKTKLFGKNLLIGFIQGISLL